MPVTHGCIVEADGWTLGHRVDAEFCAVDGMGAANEHWQECVCGWRAEGDTDLDMLRKFHAHLQQVITSAADIMESV